ncbi:MAG: DNA topoisomerase IB [Solirubrobacteraceae bacterium]
MRRRRSGRGFVYLDEQGHRVSDPEILERVRGLVIPPAWREVWICRDALGHLQATGIDAAGRKQYLYHPRWREHRDRQKFRRMASFAALLPGLRRRIAKDLAQDDLERGRVLAGAIRLLDVGLFRIGSEEYADEDGGLGLATLNKEHVTVRDGCLEFDYLAKSGVRRTQVIVDPASVALVGELRRRRSGGSQLLAYKEGRRWHPIRSDDINEFLKSALGEEFSAKDFRTWNATVLAAVALAADGRRADTKAARKRAIDRAVKAVAELLGNTPAVARRSYIDPRVVDRYLSGWTIAGVLDRIPELNAADDRVRARLEAAVLDLLADNRDSPALERD